MPADSSSPTNRALCAAHGLTYDPSQRTGCVLCQREHAATRAAGVSGKTVIALWAMVALACAAFLVASRSGDVARVAKEPRDAAPRATSTLPAARSTPIAPPSERPLRVLFIGNSLTTENDLAGMIAHLAAAAGEPRALAPRVESVGGFSLADHLAAKRAVGALGQGLYDVVVLQEQGQRPGWPDKREHDFFASARAFDAAIRGAGSRTVLYATPARRDGDPGNVANDTYEAMQRRVNDSYAVLGAELHADVVPVGRAWQTVLRMRPALPLWSQDGLHPSVAGTYLAACSFYARLYGRSPAGNRYVAGLDRADALALQDVAALVALAGDIAPAPAARTQAPPVEAVVERAHPASQPLAPSKLERDQLRHERIAAGIRARALRADHTRIPISIYKTIWCPSCQRASAYMRQTGISVREFDIERDPEARASAHRLNPRGSVPTIDVDGDVLVGWSEARFEAMLAAAARR